jgi:hypothetical protein
VAPSPETTVILPVTEALERFALAACGCRARAGWASSSNAIEIAEQAANNILRTIFIAVAVNLRSWIKTFSDKD